jgi:hypothetical protein
MPHILRGIASGATHVRGTIRARCAYLKRRLVEAWPVHLSPPLRICVIFAGVAGVLLLCVDFRDKPKGEPVQTASYEALARRQGAAYAQAVAFERKGAGWSAQMRASESVITVTMTPSERAWRREHDGRMAQDAAQPGTVHLRAFVADASDGRFVPGLSVHARFFDRAGESLGAYDLPFGLYPLTDAYGANVTVPPDAAGLAIYLDTLTAVRDGDTDGEERFGRPLRAQFALQSLPASTGEPASLRAAHAPQPLLLAQSEAVDAARTSIGEKSSGSGQIAQGDMLLGYAIGAEDTKGLRAQPAGPVQGEKDNARLDVVPRDAQTGRFLPDAKVTVTVESFDGTPLRTLNLPYRWNPWLHRYGENWAVPAAKPYQLKVQVSPPEAPIYGERMDHRLETSAEVTITRDGVRTTQN